MLQRPETAPTHAESAAVPSPAPLPGALAWHHERHSRRV